MSTRSRHPNRTSLRVVPTPASQEGSTTGGTVLGCRCPVRTVAGTVWAYDRALGWHEPAEHDTWTPPVRPVHAPMPVELLQLLDPERPRPPANSKPTAGARHVLAPAGAGLVACRRCQLVFDADAYARERQPLPACQPTPAPWLSPEGPALPGDEEDA